MPAIFLYPSATEITDALLSKSAAAQSGREQIFRDAAWLASLNAPSITAQSGQSSQNQPRPSGDSHDYVSIGTYWWPNPETLDGLPFVHRDGEFSPVLYHYDRLAWDLHCDGIAVFALAGQIGRNYNAQINRWIEAWTVDPKTRMNPHLDHAQFCPGHDTGRLVGSIDFTVRLPRFIDVVRRLATRLPKALPSATLEGFTDWWNQMLDWFIRPDVRRWHTEMGNNIGVYYDRSVIYLALWLGREDLADEILDTVVANRVDLQIKPDGQMPHELKRTRSFSYTLMNTLGFIDLVTMAEERGRDLFEEQGGRGGGSIARAVDWIWAQASHDQPWPGQQIGPVEWNRLVRLRWCLPPKYRNRYPLSSISPRLDEVLRADPELDLLSFRLHPFHLPIWDEYPQVFQQPVAGGSDSAFDS